LALASFSNSKNYVLVEWGWFCDNMWKSFSPNINSKKVIKQNWFSLSITCHQLSNVSGYRTMRCDKWLILKKTVWFIFHKKNILFVLYKFVIFLLILKKNPLSSYISNWGGVVKVEIYEVDTKIELYVDTFWLGL